MSTNTRENIQDELDFVFLSLISKKLNVGLIGGGKGGLIKANTFVRKGCSLWVLSKSFIKEFEELKDLGANLIKGEYYEDFIIDKHIVIIAVDDFELKEKVIENCSKHFKIYIDCTDFKVGMGVVPAQSETNNIAFSVHTKGGNPRGAMLLLNKMKKELLVYDEFMEAISPIRNKVKKLEHKNEITSFINTEDFKFFYERGYIKEILLLFFNEDEVKYILDM